MENALDPSKRFANRVSDYVKYRPGYPQKLIDFLQDKVGLEQSGVVADIGSGTGIFSELLLKNGNRVFGVEPNQEMRQYAEAAFSSEKKFISQAGSAEKTGLSDESVDLVVCAQSFHWFDHAKAKEEFIRISKPPHKVVLVWNERVCDGNDFDIAYENFIARFGTDYQKTKHTNYSQSAFISQFFTDGLFHEHHFTNHQDLNFDGLLGRVLSCSYMPEKSHENYATMKSALKEIFDSFQNQGMVRINYRILVYHGTLKQG